MNFSLRNKLLVFSLVIALLPLAIAGKYMINKTKEELKSNINDELITVVDQLTQTIDDRYVNMWRAPLLLLQNAIENEQLNIQERISLLQATPQSVPDVVTLQLTVQREGVPPIIITKSEFADQLKSAGLDPLTTMEISQARLSDLSPNNQVTVGNLTYLDAIDSWFITIVIPLRIELGGLPTTLSAQISLEDMRNQLSSHAFAKSGQILLAQADGNAIFDSDRKNLSDLDIVKNAQTVLSAGSRTLGASPYTDPNGQQMLGAYSFPTNFEWIIVVQKNAAYAYLTVTEMTRGLLLWLSVGFLLATIGAIGVSYMLTSSLLKLAKAARVLATGDLTVRIDDTKKRTKDEITELSSTFNKMVSDLKNYVAELEVTTKAKERAESELRLAHDIQQSFIPQGFPEDKDLQYWGKCDPAREVGGDFFDFFEIDENRIGFVQGDVSGKGVPAALFMAMSRTLIRMIGVRILEPDKALYEFNERLCEYEGGSNLFITMFYGVYERDTGRFVYSTAGHEMPMVKKGNEKEFRSLPQLKKTLVAGILDNIPVEAAEITLSKGDTIFIYTDGLTEPINPAGKAYGEDGLRKLLTKHGSESVKSMGEQSLKVVKDYQEDLPQFDDMTVLVLQRI